jgi:hypothetical protein
MKPKTNTEVQCFEHAHMTPAEYGVWQLCCDLSYKTGVLILDGRSMAKRFVSETGKPLGKSAIYRIINSLADQWYTVRNKRKEKVEKLGKGWLVLLEPKKRGPNGLWNAAKYKPLKHPGWVALHGWGQCIEQRTTGRPVPLDGQVDSVTCPESETLVSRQHTAPVPISGVTCPDFSVSPVPPAGHNPKHLLNPNINPNLNPSLNPTGLCVEGEKDSPASLSDVQPIPADSAENESNPSGGRAVPVDVPPDPQVPPVGLGLGLVGRMFALPENPWKSDDELIAAAEKYVAELAAADRKN